MNSHHLPLLLLSLVVAACGDKGDDTEDPAAIDADADGFDQADDCDDNDATVFPGADETCNGIDDDCDGEADEDAVDAEWWFPDADGDGYGDETQAVASCPDAPAGIAQGGDCDDADPTVNPDAEEVCDGVDNDCSGQVDGDDATDATTLYVDADGDGYGDPDSPVTACTHTDGEVDDDTDCDDTSAEAYPGGTEICDGLDNDCDGTVDPDSVPGEYPTLQDAVDDLADGSEICVAAGTYTDVVDVSGRVLTIMGASGAIETFLDLGEGSTPFITAEGDGTELVVRGFTVTGLDAEASDGWGGALLWSEDAVVAFEQVAITANRVTHADHGGEVEGGLISADGGEVHLFDVAISDFEWTFAAGDGGTAQVEGGLAYMRDGLLHFEQVTVDDVRVSADGNAEKIRNRGLIAEVYLGTYLFRNVSFGASDLTQSADDSSYQDGGLIYLSFAEGDMEDLSISDVTALVEGARATQNGLLYAYEGTHHWADVRLDDNTVGAAGTGSSTTAQGLVQLVAVTADIDGLSASGNAVAADHVDDTSGVAQGGVLRLTSGSLALRHADLRANTLDGTRYAQGGGLALSPGSGGEVILENVILAGNTTGSADTYSSAGGGLWLYAEYAPASLVNVDLVANELSGYIAYGGGLYIDGGGSNGVAVTNTQVVDSTLSGEYTSGQEAELWDWDDSGSDRWTYNNVYNGGSDLYGAVDDMTGSGGNVSVDPAYTDTSSSDPLDWDLTLSSSSTVIDQGDPGLVDTDGSRSDMGAYGGEGGGW